MIIKIISICIISYAMMIQTSYAESNLKSKDKSIIKTSNSINSSQDITKSTKDINKINPHNSNKIGSNKVYVNKQRERIKNFLNLSNQYHEPIFNSYIIGNAILRYMDPKTMLIYVKLRDTTLSPENYIIAKTTIEEYLSSAGFKITNNRMMANIIIDIRMRFTSMLDIKTVMALEDFLMTQQLQNTLDGANFQLSSNHNNNQNTNPLYMMGGAGLGLLIGWLANPSTFVGAASGALIGATAGYGLNTLVEKRKTMNRARHIQVHIIDLIISQKVQNNIETKYKTALKLSQNTYKEIYISTNETWLDYKMGLISIAKTSNKKDLMF